MGTGKGNVIGLVGTKLAGKGAVAGILGGIKIPLWNNTNDMRTLRREVDDLLAFLDEKTRKSKEREI